MSPRDKVYGDPITYNGKTHTLEEWAKRLNTTYSVLAHRLRRGWSVNRTLSTPPEKVVKRMRFDGRNMTYQEWEYETGIKQRRLRRRRAAGWTEEQTVTTRVRKYGRQINYAGQNKTLREWAETLGINYNTLYYRLYRLGLPIEEAFTAPLRR